MGARGTEAIRNPLRRPKCCSASNIDPIRSNEIKELPCLSASNVHADQQLEARFGYGFAAFGDHFTSLPEIALGLSDTGRDYSLGWRLVRGGGLGCGSFALSVETQRRKPANEDIVPEHRVGLRIDARF